MKIVKNAFNIVKNHKDFKVSDIVCRKDRPDYLYRILCFSSAEALLISVDNVGKRKWISIDALETKYEVK